MGKARYSFQDLGKGKFTLLEDGMVIAVFSRSSFRHDLETLNKGNGWIGSILRLLNKLHPPAPSPPFRPNLSEADSPEAVFRTIGHKDIAEYLRFKGYIVYKQIPVSDDALITHLKTLGYTVEAQPSPAVMGGEGSGSRAPRVLAGLGSAQGVSL